MCKESRDVTHRLLNHAIISFGNERMEMVKGVKRTDWRLIVEKSDLDELKLSGFGPAFNRCPRKSIKLQDRLVFYSSESDRGRAGSEHFSPVI